MIERDRLCEAATADLWRQRPRSVRGGQSGGLLAASLSGGGSTPSGFGRATSCPGALEILRARDNLRSFSLALVTPPSAAALGFANGNRGRE